jgi:hypothetical protein
MFARLVNPAALASGSKRRSKTHSTRAGGWEAPVELLTHSVTLKCEKKIKCFKSSYVNAIKLGGLWVISNNFNENLMSLVLIHCFRMKKNMECFHLLLD